MNKHIKKKMDEILELRFNWNGKDSKSYNAETIERVKSFLISLIKDFRILYKHELDTPMIFPNFSKFIVFSLYLPIFLHFLVKIFG